MGHKGVNLALMRDRRGSNSMRNTLCPERTRIIYLARSLAKRSENAAAMVYLVCGTYLTK